MVTLQVLSWNIDRRSGGLDRRLAALSTFGADVALLQEVSRGTAHGLAAAAGYDWAEAAVLHSEPTGGPSARTVPTTGSSSPN